MHASHLTHFAPPDRDDRREVLELSRKLKGTVLSPWFDDMPTPLLVLNEHRQIVFCNQAFQELTQNLGLDDMIGMRPGEALGCIHASRMEAGCGTSEFCRFCGAAQAILNCLRGKDDCQECHLTRRDEHGEHSLDLQVFSRAEIYQGRPFVLFTVLDISREKLLHYLEKSFFHDLINAVGGLDSLSRMPTSLEDDPAVHASMAECARDTLDRVLYFSDLIAAERGRLMATFVPVNVHIVVERLAADVMNMYFAGDKQLVLDLEEIEIETDVRLLRHVLRILLTNAFEASAKEDQVLLSCRRGTANARISVRNPSGMDPSVRHQLFKRYMTTKGEGRGLGLHVAKMITETHLEGALHLDSSEEETEFTVTLPLAR